MVDLLLVEGIYLTAPGTDTYVCLAISLIMLALSAFASSSELTYFSLSPSDIESLEDDDTQPSKNVLTLLNDTERLLATILITNNFANVTLVMALDVAIASVVKFTNSTLEFLFTSVFLTFLLLLFGEITPKMFATRNPLKYGKLVAGLNLKLEKLFYPLATALMKSSVVVDKIMSNSTPRQLNVKELEQALDLTDKNEIKEEHKILEGIINFSEKVVSEVMTIRNDIFALDLDETPENVVKYIAENKYSRIPVYQDNLDNIRGILYIKDVLPLVAKKDLSGWQKYIRTPYVVPESKKIDDLMKDFQENKNHIAIVVDEYGGVSGLVTMDDLVSEIIGEIHDEYDTEGEEYQKIDDKTYICEGKMSLVDLCRTIGVDDETFDDIAGESDSLAGMLLEMKGDFLKEGERLEFRNFAFEVMELDNHRISKVKVEVGPESSDTDKNVAPTTIDNDNA